MTPERPTPSSDWAWSTEVAAADWWADRLEPWLDPGIRSIVPSGFEAVTRIFHPIGYADGSVGTWAELARSTGREAHPWMQLHSIATPLGQPVELPIDHPRDPYVDEGDLPEPPRSTVADVLAGFTTTADRCWFGVWDGYGQLHGSPAVALHTYEQTRWLGRFGRAGRWRRNRDPVPGLAPSEMLAGPRVRAPGRDYVLLRGPLTAVEPITGAIGRQCPNLWWPKDRSWFLVTEIDFGWTYVAGPEALVEAIEGHDDIEAMRTSLHRPATADSDDRNR
ncbi:MAG: hypothetical protein AAFO29_10070 [Actinomycetota bacterium]